MSDRKGKPLPAQKEVEINDVDDNVYFSQLAPAVLMRVWRQRRHWRNNNNNRCPPPPGVQPVCCFVIRPCSLPFPPTHLHSSNSS
jgi:hypothetical protein